MRIHASIYYLCYQFLFLNSLATGTITVIIVKPYVKQNIQHSHHQRLNLHRLTFVTESSVEMIAHRKRNLFSKYGK